MNGYKIASEIHWTGRAVCRMFLELFLSNLLCLVSVKSTAFAERPSLPRRIRLLEMIDNL